MNLKTIATASAALLMLSGAAFAQATSGGATSGTAGKNGSGPTFASDNERMMYEQNRDSLSGFFTDDTMGTLRSEEERRAAWAAMDEGKQTAMRDVCQQAMDDSGSYGESTTTICTSVMGR